MVKEKNLYKNDFDLVKKAINGNNEGFRDIVVKYHKQIIKVAVGMLGNINDAEDIAQETFLRFFRLMYQYKGEAALGTYLTKITMNLSLNALKKRKSEAWKNIDMKVNSDKHEIDYNKISDDKALIEKALQLLPENFKSVIVLRLIQGYSTKETAQMLNLPLGTVLSRLARGQQKLREIIIQLQKNYYNGG